MHKHIYILLVCSSGDCLKQCINNYGVGEMVVNMVNCGQLNCDK